MALISGERTLEIDQQLEGHLGPDLSLALAEWQDRENAKVLMSAVFETGLTKAIVVSVGIDREGEMPRKCILKAIPAGDHGVSEADSHAAALASGPAAFATEHLVEQPFGPVASEGGGVLLFQAVAGGNLSEFRPLATLWNNETLPAVARAVSESLLEDWNPAPSLTTMTPRECVTKQLGWRGENHWAVQQLEQFVGDGCDSKWVQFEEGKPLLNPLHWLRSSEEEDEIIIHCGRAHGDLHLENVFVRLTPEASADGYRLIDLSEWSDEAPLCRDIPNLLLAATGRHLPQVETGQWSRLVDQILCAAAGEPLGPKSLQTQGIEELAAQVLSAGDGWANAQDMLDDWRQAQLLGIVATALVQASVSIQARESKWWLLRLAAAALTKYKGIAPPSIEQPVPLLGLAAGQDTNAARLAEDLDSIVGGFDRRKAVVLLIGGDGLETPGIVSRQPWDLIIEFDPNTDSNGEYHGRPKDRDHRLFSFDQEPAFSLNATTWLAAAGLDGGDLAPADLRQWRQRCLPGIDRAIRAFATSSTKPAVVCVIGPVGGRERAVVESLLDALTSRAELVALGETRVADLAEYGAVQMEADPETVLGILPSRTEVASRQLAMTIPRKNDDGETEPHTIAETDVSWISKVGQVLHSGLGQTADRASPVGRGFYRGETISWLELALGADIEREIYGNLKDRITRDLSSRESLRITLRHFPGGGGTTLGRRIGWDLREEFPVLVADQVDDSMELVNRLRKLYSWTNLPCLVVVEGAFSSVVDHAYSVARANSLPCVFLIIERKAQPPKEPSERSFYLGPLTEAERREFTDAFAGQVPARRSSLERLAGGAKQTVVPFLFGLTTYESDYQGLPQYVEHSLAALSGAERDAFKLICLVHHYAALPLPSVLLAGVLGIDDSEDVRLAETVSDRAMSLLIEGRTEQWRTLHDLVAQELLKQMLASADDPQSILRETWKAKLSTLAKQLIDQVASEYGELLPADVKTILERLFILRSSAVLLTGEKEPFSELMREVPSNEGRIELMRHLAESFPGEAHYWAHLGRMLSYTVGDHAAAMEAIATALDIDDEDDVLLHVKGMIIRARMRSTIANRSELRPEDLRRQVIDDFDEARDQFERSIELNSDSEYGHVAMVQLCINAIEFGKGQSDTASYGEFLARPDASVFREMLLLAEDHLERIREIRGGETFSRHAAQAATQVNLFYDDYAALIQGWNNLMDRPELPKAPIRRQIVRVYERRAGTWAEADQGDIRRAMTLLEDNLRDDPTDPRSLVDWLRLGRFGTVGLDRAAELVHYSVQRLGGLSRDVLFYDYVIGCLLALNGRDSAARQFRTKVNASRDRALNFGNRHYSYEWLGRGTGLGQLVHHSDLRGWDANSDRVPARLTRIEGRVREISRPTSGSVTFGNGLTAFFSPGRAQLEADRHMNARVSFLVGFSYDGPRAWGVQLLDPQG